MGEFKELFQLNWMEIIIGIIVIIVAAKFLWETINWLIDKLGIEFKGKKKIENDHIAIKELSESLSKISTNQDVIMDKITSTESAIKDIKKDVSELSEDSESAKLADQQILSDRLFQRSRHYLNDLHGIPEDEYGSFKQMYKLYKDRGDGNEELCAKVDYCLKELELIPTNENYVVNKKSPLAGRVIM